MSIRVNWDNSERSIIRWTYSENWTWEEARRAVSVEAQMVDQVKHIVHAIGDLRSTGIIPPGAMTHIKSIIASRHSQIGLTVLITDSFYVTTMFNMIQVVHRRLMRQSRITVVSTERDAYAAIEAERGNKNTNMSG